MDQYAARGAHKETLLKRILIPVDGSQQSTHAVRALLDARRYDPVERVELLTVQIPLQAGKIGRGLSQAEIDAYHQEEGQAALQSASALLTDAACPSRRAWKSARRRTPSSAWPTNARPTKSTWLARTGFRFVLVPGFGRDPRPAPDGTARHAGQVTHRGASMLNILVPVDAPTMPTAPCFTPASSPRRRNRAHPPPERADARAGARRLSRLITQDMIDDFYAREGREAWKTRASCWT